MEWLLSYKNARYSESIDWVQECVCVGWVCLLLFCFVLFFSVIPWMISKIEAIILIQQLGTQNPEVKWLAKFPATCKELRLDLNPGVPTAKIQVLSSSWDFLMPTQSVPWITQPPHCSILWHTLVMLAPRVKGDKMKPRDCFISFSTHVPAWFLPLVTREKASHKALGKPIPLTWENLENYLLLAEPSKSCQGGFIYSDKILTLHIFGEECESIYECRLAWQTSGKSFHRVIDSGRVIYFLQSKE